MSEERRPSRVGSHSDPDPAPPRLIPVFQLDREALRRAVRETLFQLHLERLEKADRPGEAERLSRIALWEAVLGWVAQQRGERVNLVGPPRPEP